MLSFLHRKKESQTVAVFAVETGSVTLTVVRLVGAEATITLIDRLSINAEEGDSPKDLLRKTAGKIDEIFQKLTAKKKLHLLSHAKALVLLGSAWHVSWKEKVSIHKDKPFRMSKEIIKDAVENAFSASHKGLSIVSSHVMNIIMNGYKIADPIGKLTPSADFEVFVESAPDEALLVFGDTVLRHLPHSHPRFSTKSFAAAEAVALATDKSDFILVVPESRLTEILIVKGKSVEAVASIPSGGETIAKELFGMRLNTKNATERLSRMAKGELDGKNFAKASEKLYDSKKKFLASFRDALWSMNASARCPSDVVVAGSGATAYFLAEWIKSEDYGSQTMTSDCFKVSRLFGRGALSKNDFFAGSALPFASAVSCSAARSLTGSLGSTKNVIK